MAKRLYTYDVNRFGHVTISIADATGAQVEALIKKLPDGMVFGLQMVAEDD